MSKRAVPGRHRGLLLSAVLSWGTFFMPATYAENWVYTLRPGDNLWSIAQTHCGSAKVAQHIADHNGLDVKLPLRAGQRINIPIHLLTFAPSEAKIVATRGATFIERFHSTTLPSPRAGPNPHLGIEPAKQDDRLHMGDYLVTQAGSAVVEFADRSQLSVQPNSRVLFNKLTAFGPAGMVDTHLRFSYGRGQAEVQRQNQGNRFRIQTPEGIAAVRGTLFRVAHRQTEAAGVSNTETLEGLVSFKQSQQATELPAGFGVVASAQGTTKEALLAAPVIDPFNSPFAQGARLSWQAVPNSAAYLLTFSAADNPNIVVRQTRLNQSFTTAQLEPGDYLFSVRAVSAMGIEGYDATTPLQITTPPPKLLPVQAQLTGSVTLNWQSHLSNEKLTLELINQTTATPISVPVSGNRHTLDLPAGRYTWHVSTEAKLASGTNEFTLRPPPPEDIVATHRDGQIYLTWTARDSLDHFNLAVTRPDGTQSTHTLATNQAKIPAAEHGEYQITLASVQNSLHSAPQSVQVQVYRRPWWLIAVFPLLVL